MRTFRVQRFAFTDYGYAPLRSAAWILRERTQDAEREMSRLLNSKTKKGRSRLLPFFKETEFLLTLHRSEVREAGNSHPAT